MKRSQFAGTTVKVLALILALAMLVGFFYWKASLGITGTIAKLKKNTANSIVFIRQTPDGQTNLFLVQSDGTKTAEPLTNDKSSKRSPSWSPDGKKLCYAAETNTGGSTAYQLFILGDGDPVQATTGSIGKDYPLWRSDGSQIAFNCGGTLKVMNPNGKGVEQIYPNFRRETSDNGDNNQEQDDAGAGLKRPPVSTFQWSPTGPTIAAVQVVEESDYAAPGQSEWFIKDKTQKTDDNPQPTIQPEVAFILPSPGSKPAPLFGTAANHISFGWFPDGKRLAVALNSKIGQHFIVISHGDEPAIQPQTIFASRGYTAAPENPVVSPDGKLVAFEVWQIDRAENRQALGIAVIQVDGSIMVIQNKSDMGNLTMVAHGKASNPQWSPDGTRLLYIQPGTTGMRDIWVVNANGSNPINLTKGVGDNYCASWSPAK